MDASGHTVLVMTRIAFIESDLKSRTASMYGLFQYPVA